MKWYLASVKEVMVVLGTGDPLLLGADWRALGTL